MKTIKPRATLTNGLSYSLLLPGATNPYSPPFVFSGGREEVLKFVKGLHGFGDYAAGNVAMLLGFYEEVPLDSETVSRRPPLPIVVGPRARSPSLQRTGNWPRKQRRQIFHLATTKL